VAKLETVMNAHGKRTGVLAAFIIVLGIKYRGVLEQNTRTMVFRGFLIKPDIQNRKCLDINDLHLHFPALMSEKRYRL
jgi:hypothetical protein